MAEPLAPEAFADLCESQAHQYIEDVISGQRIAGKLEQLAVKRHMRDLLTGRDRGLVFDPAKARRVFRFWSTLRLSIGHKSGEQFVLAGWQAFTLWALFGWQRESGFRRFKVTYCQIGKKNGKTTFAAGIGLYLTSADKEDTALVYSAATKRDQAILSHKAAVAMRDRSPVLSRRFKKFKNNLTIPATSAAFVPLGNNAGGDDGIDVHGAIVDEVHRHKDRNLWDVLVFGGDARDQPLVFGITTAGANAESMCYELREHGEKVLKGIVEDDGLFVVIFEPDTDDDEDDERTWHKGNPSIGEAISIDTVRDHYRSAQAMPSQWRNFLRYRLNRWVIGSDEAYIDMDLWAECKPVEVSLEGRTCYAGLDLSATQDLTAFVLYFPPTPNDPRSHARAWFWMPNDNLEMLERLNRVPLRSWIDRGYLVATPGSSIDYRSIRRLITGKSEDGASTDVRPIAERYRIKRVGFDGFAATQIHHELADDGLEMVSLSQQQSTYNVPMRALSDQIVNGIFDHGGNPIMRWHASNTKAKPDNEDRIKPVKAEGKRRHKIDGMCALLMAMHCAETPDQKGSVYESRGVREL